MISFHEAFVTSCSALALNTLAWLNIWGSGISKLTTHEADSNKIKSACCDSLQIWSHINSCNWGTLSLLASTFLLHHPAHLSILCISSVSSFKLDRSSYIFLWDGLQIITVLFDKRCTCNRQRAWHQCPTIVFIPLLLEENRTWSWKPNSRHDAQLNVACLVLECLYIWSILQVLYYLGHVYWSNCERPRSYLSGMCSLLCPWCARETEK